MTKTNTIVDLLSGDEVDPDKPEYLSASVRTRRYGTYLLYLRSLQRDTLRRRYAEWSCRDWNASHAGGERLERLELIWVDETTPPAYETPVARPIVLLRVICP